MIIVVGYLANTDRYSNIMFSGKTISKVTPRTTGENGVLTI